MNKHVITPHSTILFRQKQYFKLEKPVAKLSREQFIEQYAHLLNPNALRVLDYLYALRINNSMVFPSLATTASHLKISERTVRRAIKRLKELGLVSTYQRWNNSLLYKLADILMDSGVQSALSRLCPTFKFLLIAWLFCPGVLTGLNLGVHVQNNIYVNIPSRNHSNDIVQDPPTVPILSDIIKKPSKLYPKNPSSFAKAPADRSKHEERTPMSEEHGGISQAIREIRCLKLSKWGQIKLSAFSEEAIRYACEQWKKGRKKPDDPFAWFFAVCTRWCKVSNVEPNWRYMESLKVRHNMPEDGRLVLPDDADKPFRPSATGSGEVKRENNTIVKDKNHSYTPRPVYQPPVHRVLTRDELIMEERKMLAFEKTPKYRAMFGEAGLPRKIDPEIRAAAEALGPAQIQTEEESEERRNRRLGLPKRQDLKRDVSKPVASYTVPHSREYLQEESQQPIGNRSLGSMTPRQILQVLQTPVQGGAKLTSEESYTNLDTESWEEV